MEIKEINEIDKPHSNCGVFGIYNHPQAALMTYYGLFSMQHRGQESAGITTFYYDDKKKKMRYAYHKGMGLVSEVFAESKIFQEQLIGNCAIGHNRYSTTGSMTRWNIQPFNVNYKSGILSLAHNGNLTNTKYLRKKLQDEGTIFQTTSDSELFLHLMAHSKKTTPLEQLQDALQQTVGAYSLVLLTEDALIGVRDPYGVRPLSIGRVKNNGNWAYIIASETCAFDIIDAEYIRSVENNEIVVIDDDTIKTGEIKSYKVIPETPIAKHCIFEFIYFARPDSKIFGENVDKVRRKLGKELAIEAPVIKDDGERVDVIGVPDSANTASLGFAHSNNKFNYPTRFEIGLIRNHYSGRTFISPKQDERVLKVKTKFNTVNGVIHNRHITLVDDSIVRGTTSQALVQLIRKAGPKSIDMRISSPPVKFPCHYGMDLPTHEELIANHHSNIEEIRQTIGADTLHYLSKEKMLESVPHNPGIDYCTACFTGEYPIPIEDELDKFSTEA